MWCSSWCNGRYNGSSRSFSMKTGVDVITMDSAHGHSNGVMDAVRKIKSEYPDLQIIAGNIATAEGIEI